MHFWEFVALVSFDKGSEGSAVPRKSGLNCNHECSAERRAMTVERWKTGIEMA